MRGVRWFVVTTLVVLALPAMAVAQSQARPIVIRASTVLDGKGGFSEMSRSSSTAPASPGSIRMSRASPTTCAG